MNEPDTRRLLAFVSVGYDNRALSQATVEVWMTELPDVSLDIAKQAVRNHFAGPLRAEYLNLKHLNAEINSLTRQRPDQVEADVRSAKARHLIDPTWPANQPLPIETARTLETIRRREIEQFNYPEQTSLHGSKHGDAVDLGQIGRPIPKEQ